MNPYNAIVYKNPMHQLLHLMSLYPIINRAQPSLKLLE